MKYSIFINQKAIATHFKKGALDLADLSIFDYSRDIITSANAKLLRVMHDGKPYTWIDYKHLIDCMPILGINTNDVIRRRMNTLVEEKLLCRHIVKTMAYFTLGEKADLLYFDPSTTEPPEAPTPEDTPQKQKEAQDEVTEAPPEEISQPEPSAPNEAENDAYAGDDDTPEAVIQPNPEVEPNFSDGVAQPTSGALPNFKDGHSPTEKRGYYNTNINQSDQNIRIKGDNTAAAHADGLPPLSPLEITFYKLWEESHCVIVRHFHKKRIRLVLEKYSPSENVIETAIKKNKREDWACEDIVRECNKIPKPRSTAKRLREYVESIRRKQRAAGIVC